MKKVTIIVLHLGYGGIEKAVTSLANMLCDNYEINIIATYKLFEKTPFFIDSRVKIDYLMDMKPNKKELLNAIKKINIFSIIKEAIKSIKVLHLRRKMMIEAIKKCDNDIIISTRPFHNNLVGKYAKKDMLKIAWEHSHHNNNRNYISTLIKSCQNMDYLISVSKELNTFYSMKLKNKPIKCEYISLFLDDMPKKTSSLERKEITTIGRLSKEKGFLDLIDVFKLVNQKYPKWHLNIVGDGIVKNSIEKKIKENNLADKVTLHGFKDRKEIDKILFNSSIYVMTSLTESFGLVLIEAMSYGVPCISFDSARGSLEIISNNIDGYIIEKRDKNKMADKIISLIENKELRNKMGQLARKKAMSFSIEEVQKEWDKMLDSKE